VKPLLDLDRADIYTSSKNSAIMEVGVLKHLIGLLVDEKNHNLAQKIHIMKAISAMMELLPKEFSELLTANDLTGKLMTYFLNLISSNKIDATKKDSIIPLNWLESKATNMRVRALENTLQLQPDFTLTCQIVEQKQLVFS